MHLKLAKAALLCAALLTLLFTANTTQAQEDKVPAARLRSPATVRGFIGGEAHDSYVIHVRKGQTLAVQISWRREDDNRADFTVSNSGDFFDSAPVKFGRESDKGRRWRGKVPRTGNYYIYVTAHPDAHYTLRITTK